MKNLQKHSIRGHKLIFLLLSAVVLSALLSLCLGAVSISPLNVLRSLLGKDVPGGTAVIIRLARLPRTCACLLAGMALAVSGAVIQTVLNNPLAAPNVIGVNAGAGFSVTMLCALLPGAIFLLPFAAFAGALAAVLLVSYISRRSGSSKMTLVLSGVAVSCIFSALTDAVITFAPDSLVAYSDFRIGSFANISFQHLRPAALVIAAALILILLFSNELELLSLGSSTAASLGLNVRAVRMLMLVLSAALAGAAVSFCGLLGFVGLVIPHIMRHSSGEKAAVQVISCALGGALMVTLCDILSRVLFAPYELPAGIMLSCIGGPFFIYLLTKRRGGHRYD